MLGNSLKLLVNHDLRCLMCQAQLEQELDDLTCSRDANEEAMIAELMKEGSCLPHCPC